MPLGPDNSGCNHEELRIVLRSLEKHAKNLGKVFIVTDCGPSWLKNVRLIAHGDPHKHNKDANLIEKVITACNCDDLSDKFIFWSDDQALVQDYDLYSHTPVYNNRTVQWFIKANSTNRWIKRMLNTFKMLQDRGKGINFNWESHTPQPMNKHLFPSIMESVDFRANEGMAINTTYFGLLEAPPIIEQQMIKDTFENSHQSPVFKHPFIGWNDSGYTGGLRKVLLDTYKESSKYEK